MTVTWYGDDLLKQIRAGMDDALFEGGTMLRDAAAERAPKRSGRLYRSGYVSTKSKSDYRKVRWYKKEKRPTESGVAVIAFAAPHSHLLEYGTAKMSARPYLRPALDSLKDQLGTNIVVVISRKLK